MLRGQRATRCLAGAASVLLLHQDVNWDLQNYHFYNGWAFVYGRLGWDLAPAHGLRRMPGGCASIVSKISPDPLELCLLDRIHSPGLDAARYLHVNRRVRALSARASARTLIALAMAPHSLLMRRGRVAPIPR
jgi:hypothetical protein